MATEGFYWSTVVLTSKHILSVTDAVVLFLNVSLAKLDDRLWYENKSLGVLTF